jgi:hypothetical protein
LSHLRRQNWVRFAKLYISSLFKFDYGLAALCSGALIVPIGLQEIDSQLGQSDSGSLRRESEVRQLHASEGETAMKRCYGGRSSLPH